MNSNEFVKRLHALRRIFNDCNEPSGKDAAIIDKRMRNLMDAFLEDAKTGDDFDVGKMDALIGELEGLHELRQMMELATEPEETGK